MRTVPDSLKLVEIFVACNDWSDDLIPSITPFKERIAFDL